MRRWSGDPDSWREDAAFHIDLRDRGGGYLDGVTGRGPRTQQVHSG